jgi:hypothetical protein
MFVVQEAVYPNIDLLARIEPRRVARFETENWAAYYQKRWLKLLAASVNMVREAFRLNLLEALLAAYWTARAEMAAAPFPDNDIPTAEAYMRRFYAFIKRRHGLGYDPAVAARLEVNWWVVHRRLFGQPNNEELVQALTDLYRVVYGVSDERAKKAGFHRARAMCYSDQWVAAGKKSGSPLLLQVEVELCRAYAALRGGLR